MPETLRSKISALTPLPVKLAVRSLYDRESRAVFRYLLSAKGNAHQATPATALNRYPETFAMVRELTRDRNSMRILSFGCSTGEEVITLRRYFPEATIVGADVNAKCIETCRTLEVDDRIIFVESTADNIEAHGPYDAIFAMAVLQRLPHLVERMHVTNLAQLYPFELFDRQLGAFDRWLKPGGLVIIQNTQYRFTDAAIAPRYRVLGYEAASGPTVRHFDPRGRLLRQQGYREIVFAKQS